MKKVVLNVVAVMILAVSLMSVVSCQKENPGQPTTSNSVVNCVACNGNGDSKVFPANADMYGHSYSYYAGAWWKWFIEVPDNASHPLFYPTGNVTEGQSGNVWYLNGIFGSTLTRSITIPDGKALCIPIFNTEWSSIEYPAAPSLTPHPPTTMAAQLSLAEGALNGANATSLFCNIDGESVSNLSNYLFTSPQYSFIAPNPNVLQDPAAGGWSGNLYGHGTSTAYGYYVIVKPLSHGSHTIHFGASLPGYGAYIDMTYNITVN